ncbi:MAG TPA: S4 domain-containing protein, partial [Candidatus Nanoarchaeia archaeon]|nr:S4 domain-containing protein [Candidatus Nanoarchaeia archaeon]
MQLAITSDDLNLRIDKFLRARLVNAPLSVIFKFLRSKVKINGKKVEPSYRIKENDSIELLISEQEFENLSKTKNKTPQRQTF